ncbi:MAG: hypothetical protein N3A57_07430, partial [Negativicutes bacterium]|nr:hypothetical protein [Negativicutes bacterium]
MRRQFRDTLNSLAGDERIVLLLADLSVYLFDSFRQKYPERFYNLGICEGAVVSIAAGVSLQGFIPFVHSIAPFITERCYEQIKLDVCYNQAPINIVSCGATVDYAYDGATHNCYNDMEILRLLPGVEVLQPGSDREVDFLLRHHYDNGRCTYFRLSDYPHQLLLTVEPYKGTVVRDCGSEVTVFTAGPVLQHVVSGLQDLSVNIVYFHTISPLDQTVLPNYS